MVFWIILLILLFIGFVACIFFHEEELTVLSCIIFVACVAIFIALVKTRRTNIYTYQEAKAHPEYFSNSQRIKDNEVIAKIKAHQGTIFSFYNGIEFEYFEIEDGSKVIIKE